MYVYGSTRRPNAIAPTPLADRPSVKRPSAARGITRSLRRSGFARTGVKTAGSAGVDRRSAGRSMSTVSPATDAANSPNCHRARPRDAFLTVKVPRHAIILFLL